MESRKIAAIVLLAVVLVAGTMYLGWAYFVPQPGAYLEGDVTIEYEDGTAVKLGSVETPLFRLMRQFSVITYQDKKLWSISTNVNLHFVVDPPDKSVQAQYWVMYWVEVDGTFYWGGRLYTGLTGFIDTPLRTYQANKGMNKWSAKVYNPELGWFLVKSFVEPFYAESTSSVWVDLSTMIVDPKSVTDSLSGLPLVGSLADKLGASLTKAEIWNEDRPLLVRWSMTGPNFYVRLKRSNFKGLSFHVADFSIGLGEFARMWDNDVYKVKFQVGYFFRYQDVTGDWTDWKSGTVTVATLDMKVSEGSYYVLSADVSGGVKLG